MPKQKFYETQAATLIKNMEKRGFEGFFVRSGEEAAGKILELIQPGSVIGWGGSVSVEETGIFELLRQGDYTLLDRRQASTPEEARQLYARTVLADTYLMSTNAITLDGELVNIDGSGNRVACLIHGPGQVIIVAGMNKVCPDKDSAYLRVKNMASPPNCVRLGKKTPCAATGRCGDCYSPDSICSHTVITRRSGIPGRIKVILVGEELGF